MSGAQKRSRAPPTLTSGCADLQTIRRQIRKVRPPAERLAALLQKLKREVRGRVLGRLSEWQRLQLEQQLLRKVKESRGTQSSSALAPAVKQISRKPGKRHRRLAKRKVRCVVKESHGIFRRQTPGGQKFRASISFCNLRLQARPRSCVQDAERDLECLATVRNQVLQQRSPFEDCVRRALCKPEIRSSVASRHITLQVTSNGLCRQVLRSPVYGLNQLDTALAAWSSLREARRFGLKPSKQRRRLPTELCDSWKQLRSAHQDLWQKAGAKTERVQKVLERIEHLAESEVQAGWERWNRVRMAAEERLVRRQRRREWQELSRMRQEDAASRRFSKQQMKEASREADILRRIDVLLSKWPLPHSI